MAARGVRRYPSDMTDAKWAVVRPLLPLPAWLEGRGGQPEGCCHHITLDAVRHLLGNGIKWRAVPADFPAWDRVNAIFRRWRRQGLIAEFHHRLRARVPETEGREAEPTAAVIDSQSLRAADTVGAGSRGWDQGKKVGGRKRHLAVDCAGLLLVVHVTPASVQDRDAAVPVLNRLRGLHRKIALAWADAGYASRLAPPRAHDRQTKRQPEGVRRRAPPLGGRAHTGLADAPPTPGSRLRTPARHPRDDGHVVHDHGHGTPPRTARITQQPQALLTQRLGRTPRASPPPPTPAPPAAWPSTAHTRSSRAPPPAPGQRSDPWPAPRPRLPPLPADQAPTPSATPHTQRETGQPIPASTERHPLPPAETQPPSSDRQRVLRCEAAQPKQGLRCEGDGASCPGRLAGGPRTDPRQEGSHYDCEDRCNPAGSPRAPGQVGRGLRRVHRLYQDQAGPCGCSA